MMQKENYEKIFAVIQSVEGGEKLLCSVEKIITVCTVLCYFATIGGRVFAGQWKELAVILLVPGISFVGVSLFRRYYNAKRPYELYGFTPLIEKDTQGKSFPSRHVFSIFVLAVTIGVFYPMAAVGLGISGMLLAVIRVAAGIHFPKDVIAGGIIGVVFGGIAQVILLLIS